MKKYLLFLLLLLITSGCTTLEEMLVVEPGTISKGSHYRPDNDRGITLELVEGSLSNTSILLTLTNDADKTIYFGTPFAIEKFENDKWNSLRYVNDKIAWTMPLLYVDPGEKTEIGSRDWEYMYGSLPAGKYRFIKSVYFEEDKEFTISYEFELE